MMKFYEGFRQNTSGDKAICLVCGATNQAGTAVCENCSAALPQPAPFFQNLAQVVVQPMKAMPRIASIAPVMQAFLVVILGVLAFLLQGAISSQRQLENLLSAVNEYNAGKPDTLTNFFVTSDQPKPDLATILPKFRDSLITNPIIPGPAWILFYFILLIVSWIFFTIAIFYTIKLLFRRDEPRTKFYSLLSVVGFARIANLAIFIYLLPSDQTIGSILSLAVLIWQILLLVIGTKFSTGLSWSKAAIGVVIPVLVMQFLLRLPI